MRQKNEPKEYSWPLLYTVDETHIDKAAISAKNRGKSWTYGYHEKYDVIVISKNGQIGEVYDIEGIKIALPKTPKAIPKRENKWVAIPVPKELARIKTRLEWSEYDNEFKAKHVPYIEEEFNRREFGYWFYNNSVPTYMTGKHYMYLQHSKTDTGRPDFREANRIWHIFWQACISDERSFGMIYLKIRRSGFSFMGASSAIETATLARDASVGMLSKTGADAKKLFTDKVVPISMGYPFFFKPIQSGQDRPKSAIEYTLPASRITKKNMHGTHEYDEFDALDTVVDWKSTDDNSYDGQKLLELLHDESSKWVLPLNILNNWRVTKTCLRLGAKIVGKCCMGSTVNALAKGGANYKKLYELSDQSDRTKNGQTRSGLYRLFIPMEWNFEGFIDEYGWPVFVTPKKPVMGVDGSWITQGVIEYWDNEVEARKNDPDDLNEFYRQFPRTESHAFRDESKASIFNLTKIYEQIDHNDGLGYTMKQIARRGNFSWKDGKRDTEVVWTPDPKGKFNLGWMPGPSLTNNVRKQGDLKFPKNKHLGMFGCDPYDINGTVGGGGSKGSLHGLTKTNTDDNVPSSRFFLEYISRPPTAEIFFEDVLMAIHYYGMEILVENNKVRLLVYLKMRGYRAFAMNRPDKPTSALSKNELSLGGIPNSSVDVIQTHADCIASYIEEQVGYDKEETYRSSENCGEMPFMETLKDWATFDITNRTKHDASISSGLAIMGTRKHKLTPIKESSEIKFNFAMYDNSGTTSKIIRNG